MPLELNSGRESQNSAAAPSPGKGESILVVDDEIPFLTITSIMLAASGYRVMKASTAKEAMEILNAGQGKVDLMITDIHMPGLTGVELIRKLRSTQRSPSVIASSGSPEFDHAEDLAALGVSSLLIKPFGKQTLLDAVQCAMSGNPGAYRIRRS